MCQNDVYYAYRQLLRKMQSIVFKDLPFYRSLNVGFFYPFHQARKIEEWRLRKKRRDEEREIKLRKQRAEERARAHAEAQKSAPAGEESAAGGGVPPGGMPGGFPGAGAGGMPGGFPGGMPGMDKLLNDPEIMELFSDPGKPIYSSI